MSLASKLAEVMGSVQRIPKSGKNTFLGYDYVTEADLVEAIRGELAKRQIVLVPNCLEQSMKDMPPTAKGKAQFLTTLMMEFSFIDGESAERVTFKVPGYGIDGEDKGGYKALTGAEKYALMKFFLVPTGDDPERDERKKEKEQEFLKCEKCNRNITPYTKPDGTKVTLAKVMDAGRQKWNKDLCGGCQIQLTREERESREQAAKPKPEPKASKSTSFEPQEFPVDNPEIAEIDGEWHAAGTITQIFHMQPGKAFCFKMGRMMFSCWHFKTLVPKLKDLLQHPVEVVYSTKDDFKNVERIVSVDGELFSESLYLQDHEIANA